MVDLMHPNYWQITILLVVDLCSSLAYFMMIQPLPIAGKLPIKTLVAKQLPTNIYIYICTKVCIIILIQLYSVYNAQCHDYGKETLPNTRVWYSLT